MGEDPGTVHRRAARVLRKAELAAGDRADIADLGAGHREQVFPPEPGAELGVHLEQIGGDEDVSPLRLLPKSSV